MRVKIGKMTMINPMLHVDMIRIGSRVCALENCNMCNGCYNRHPCIHLTRWKRIKAAELEVRRKAHQDLKRAAKRGGKRECESGFHDDGLTCSKALHCETSCGGVWYDPRTWHCDTHCSGPEMYGKFDDELKGAFNEVGKFFSNLPGFIKDIFSPNGPLAHTFDPNLNGVGDGIKKLGADVKAKMEGAFDPEKNGVAEAFRKFGLDIESAYEFVGNKLHDYWDQAAAKLKESFAPMLAAFKAFGEAMDEYFSEPSNCISFVAMVLTTFGSLLPTPIGEVLCVLGACEQMIGDAVLGKPFDPMNLMDLISVISLPAGARVAATIAKTTSKCTSIAAKIGKGISTAKKIAVASMKDGIKKIAQMSKGDKALLVGKAVVQIGGKMAAANPPPVEDTSNDQTTGDDYVDDQNDPQHVINARKLGDLIDKEDYDAALQAERDEGTIAGAYKKQKRSVVKTKEDAYEIAAMQPSIAQMVDKATKSPRSYTKDEKIYFYRTTNGNAAAQKVADAAKATASIKSQQLQDEARATKDKTAAQVARDAEAANYQQDKDAEEERKYGMTFLEAKERLKLYKTEQDKFSTATGTVPKKNLHPPKTGGVKNVDAAAPEFMMSDLEDRGEGEFGDAPYLPPIFTPTFFHFVKGKFAEIPVLDDPENWYPAYNKFWTCYNRQKTNYQKLIDANKIALEARHNLSHAEKFKLYQKWQASDYEAQSPINLAVAAKALGRMAFLDFIRNEGFDEHSWNNQMAILNRDDLKIDVDPVVPRDPPPKPMIPTSDKAFFVPEADPINFPEHIGLTGGDSPFVQPALEDAIAYYRYKLTRDDPFHVYDETEIRAAYEQDWQFHPQPTLAAINQYKASPPPSQIGKGRKRHPVAKFFGGAWDTSLDVDPFTGVTGSPAAAGDTEELSAEDIATEAANILSIRSEKHQEFTNIIDAEAHDDLAHEIYGTDLPAALAEYMAAKPDTKRQARAKISAIRDWATVEFGVPKEDDTWLPKFYDFDDDLHMKAPEFFDEGEDEELPRQAFDRSAEGQAQIALVSTAKQSERVAKAAESKSAEATAEIESQIAEEEGLFADWKKTYDEEIAAAQTPEEMDTATEKFNGHFPEGDPRRRSGSGHHHHDDRPVATKIMPNLWLGNMKDAQNKKWLKARKIHTVFNMTPDLDESPSCCRTVRFSILDSPDDVDKMVGKGLDWADEIMEAMEAGPVLVHCKEGRQRSATLVTLIMGLKNPQKLHTVIKKLRSKRPIALTPQPTFAKALKKWFI